MEAAPRRPASAKPSVSRGPPPMPLATVTARNAEEDTVTSAPGVGQSLRPGGAPGVAGHRHTGAPLTVVTARTALAGTTTPQGVLTQAAQAAWPGSTERSARQHLKGQEAPPKDEGQAGQWKVKGARSRGAESPGGSAEGPVAERHVERPATAGSSRARSKTKLKSGKGQGQEHLRASADMLAPLEQPEARPTAQDQGRRPSSSQAEDGTTVESSARTGALGGGAKADVTVSAHKVSREDSLRWIADARVALRHGQPKQPTRLEPVPSGHYPHCLFSLLPLGSPVAHLRPRVKALPSTEPASEGGSKKRIQSKHGPLTAQGGSKKGPVAEKGDAGSVVGAARGIEAAEAEPQSQALPQTQATSQSQPQPPSQPLSQSQALSQARAWELMAEEWKLVAGGEGEGLEGKGGTSKALPEAGHELTFGMRRQGPPLPLPALADAAGPEGGTAGMQAEAEAGRDGAALPEATLSPEAGGGSAGGAAAERKRRSKGKSASSRKGPGGDPADATGVTDGASLEGGQTEKGQVGEDGSSIPRARRTSARKLPRAATEGPQAADTLPLQELESGGDSRRPAKEEGEKEGSTKERSRRKSARLPKSTTGDEKAGKKGKSRKSRQLAPSNEPLSSPQPPVAGATGGAHQGPPEVQPSGSAFQVQGQISEDTSGELAREVTGGVGLSWGNPKEAPLHAHQGGGQEGALKEGEKQGAELDPVHVAHAETSEIEAAGALQAATLASGTGAELAELLQAPPATAFDTPDPPLTQSASPTSVTSAELSVVPGGGSDSWESSSSHGQSSPSWEDMAQVGFVTKQGTFVTKQGNFVTKQELAVPLQGGPGTEQAAEQEKGRGRGGEKGEGGRAAVQLDPEMGAAGSTRSTGTPTALLVERPEEAKASVASPLGAVPSQAQATPPLPVPAPEAATMDTATAATEAHVRSWLECTSTPANSPREGLLPSSGAPGGPTTTPEQDRPRPRAREGTPPRSSPASGGEGRPQPSGPSSAKRAADEGGPSSALEQAKQALRGARPVAKNVTGVPLVYQRGSQADERPQEIPVSARAPANHPSHADGQRNGQARRPQDEQRSRHQGGQRGRPQGGQPGQVRSLVVRYGPFLDIETAPVAALDGRMRKLAQMTDDLKALAQHWDDQEHTCSFRTRSRGAAHERPGPGPGLGAQGGAGAGAGSGTEAWAGQHGSGFTPQNGAEWVGNRFSAEEYSNSTAGTRREHGGLELRATRRTLTQWEPDRRVSTWTAGSQPGHRSPPPGHLSKGPSESLGARHGSPNGRPHLTETKVLVVPSSSPGTITVTYAGALVCTIAPGREEYMEPTGVAAFDDRVDEILGIVSEFHHSSYYDELV